MATDVRAQSTERASLSDVAWITAHAVQAARLPYRNHLRWTGAPASGAIRARSGINGVAGSTGARHRARPDRVPTDLLQRTSVHHWAVLRRPGSRVGVHRDHPARHRECRDHLFSQGHLADHQELGAGIDRQAAAQRSRGQVGLAGDHWIDSDRGAGAGVPGRNRSWAAKPLDDRRHARRLWHRHRRDRPGGLERPPAGVPQLATRAVSRARAVACLDPGRFPIRCHHRRWAGARLPTGCGRQVLLLAGHTSRRWLRLVQACRRLLRPSAAGLGANCAGDCDLVCHWLRGDRLVAALCEHAYVHAIRDLSVCIGRASGRLADHRGIKPVTTQLSGLMID